MDMPELALTEATKSMFKRMVKAGVFPIEQDQLDLVLQDWEAVTQG